MFCHNSNSTNGRCDAESTLILTILATKSWFLNFGNDPAPDSREVYRGEQDLGGCCYSSHSSSSSVWETVTRSRARGSLASSRLGGRQPAGCGSVLNYRLRTGTPSSHSCFHHHQPRHCHLHQAFHHGHCHHLRHGHCHCKRTKTVAPMTLAACYGVGSHQHQNHFHRVSDITTITIIGHIMNIVTAIITYHMVTMMSTIAALIRSLTAAVSAEEEGGTYACNARQRDSILAMNCNSIAVQCNDIIATQCNTKVYNSNVGNAITTGLKGVEKCFRN